MFWVPEKIIQYFSVLWCVNCSCGDFLILKIIEYFLSLVAHTKRNYYRVNHTMELTGLPKTADHLPIDCISLCCFTIWIDLNNFTNIGSNSTIDGQ